MKTQEMIMKRSTIAKTFAIATFTALALGIAPTAKADSNKGCSNASLTGTFAYRATGSSVPPLPPGQYAEVGTQTFDGKGGTTVVGMSSTNGSVAPVAITGTYTVNPDCTGIMILPIAPGIAAHYFFALDDSGAGFESVCLDPVAVVTRVGRRQFPVGDWRF